MYQRFVKKVSEPVSTYVPQKCNGKHPCYCHYPDNLKINLPHVSMSNTMKVNDTVNFNTVNYKHVMS